MWTEISTLIFLCETQLKLCSICKRPEEMDFFNRPNPSSRTVALGSTQPLTEMSTRNHGCDYHVLGCNALWFRRSPS
jgi:hypothetical protein